MVEAKTEFESYSGEVVRLIRSTLLIKSGLQHGFIGKPLNFGRSLEQESIKALVSETGVKKIFYPIQRHTASFIRLEHASNLSDILQHGAEADAIIAPRDGLAASEPCIIAVRTADCVPIIIASKEWVSVVHAGWRGLANGILQNVLSCFSELCEGDTLYVAIGPCAGKMRYEVGREVIEAIKPQFAVYTELESKKCLLSLSESAEMIIKSFWKGVVSVSSSGICTISNTEYHSYRREGVGVGSNLAFVIIGS